MPRMEIVCFHDPDGYDNEGLGSQSNVWSNWGPNSRSSGSDVHKPVVIGRVLDDCRSQVTKYGYNSGRHIAKQIDPLGLKATYGYSATRLDSPY